MQVFFVAGEKFNGDVNSPKQMKKFKNRKNSSQNHESAVGKHIVYKK